MVSPAEHGVDGALNIDGQAYPLGHGVQEVLPPTEYVPALHNVGFTWQWKIDICQLQIMSVSTP